MNRRWPEFATIQLWQPFMLTHPTGSSFPNWACRGVPAHERAPMLEVRVISRCSDYPPDTRGPTIGS